MAPVRWKPFLVSREPKLVRSSWKVFRPLDKQSLNILLNYQNFRGSLIWFPSTWLRAWIIIQAVRRKQFVWGKEQIKKVGCCSMSWLIDAWFKSFEFICETHQRRDEQSLKRFHKSSRFLTTSWRNNDHWLFNSTSFPKAFDAITRKREHCDLRNVLCNWKWN